MTIKTFWLFLFTLLIVSVNGVAQDVDKVQPVDDDKKIEIETKEETEQQDENIETEDEIANLIESQSGIELSEKLKGVVDQLLYVHFIVTMIPPGNQNAWTKQGIRYTIPGKAVLVKIEGETIKFNGSFVPFKEEYNYNLVAMSQIWMKTQNSNKMKFLSTFKMVTFSSGEKIFYYPLGLPTNEEDPFYSIKIEIDIMPYLEYKASKAEQDEKIPQ